ncbi:ribosome biogenesis factor YjgA [Halopseudomonas salegens]|uniref:Dual-action ribosomal maturation protein DarP n=1 Tax=Halopseudomonas salegens TaxID=1434072 RepID=A0A1H2EB03_9GAMM|nr:ribosome biogenesis factor YjgA [Halopseudomonas salegens]SDT92193.1 ribosome-associated protein [Halopseudomonas salegens]
MTDFEDEEQLDEGPSKSQIKRELHELRELGQRLTELKPEQLDKLNLKPKLRLALEEAPRHTARGALKRHLSFVGKLVRDEDIDSIRALIERMDSSSQAHAEYFHQLERWRDRLVSGKPDELEAFIASYPQAADDRQTLRQLIRQATKEAAENKPPAASRKIFKRIREIVEND